VLQSTELERLAKDKHSSLLVQFVSYEEKEVLCFWALVKELYILGNLRIGPISLSVTKHWARKACQGWTF
jgi:hypothetical protein